MSSFDSISFFFSFCWRRVWVSVCVCAIVSKMCVEASSIRSEVFSVTHIISLTDAHRSFSTVCLCFSLYILFRLVLFSSASFFYSDFKIRTKIDCTTCNSPATRQTDQGRALKLKADFRCYRFVEVKSGQPGGLVRSNFSSFRPKSNSNPQSNNE